jgi:hypothetical protein
MLALVTLGALKRAIPAAVVEVMAIRLVACEYNPHPTTCTSATLHQSLPSLSYHKVFVHLTDLSAAATRLATSLANAPTLLRVAV